MAYIVLGTQGQRFRNTAVQPADRAKKEGLFPAGHGSDLGIDFSCATSRVCHLLQVN